jgi:hypothetical protein
MAETREKDPLGSSSESENEDEDARQARRDRRELMKTIIVDETLLDKSFERQEQDEVESCADRLRRINTGGEVESAVDYSQIKKPNVPFVRKKPTASLNGAGGIALESRTKASLNGAPSVPVDRVNHLGTNTGMASQYGAAPEAVSNNGAYSSVNSLRKGMKTNPNLRGGTRVEKASVGSFANPGDDRINICHTRFIVEKKQNISLSFDPTSMICYSCHERGGHPVCIEEEGGEAMFHLGRPNLSCSLALQKRGMCQNHPH